MSPKRSAAVVPFHFLSSVMSSAREMSQSVTPYKNQEYSELKAACLNNGKLFEDPEFPAVDSSLFFKKSPPGAVKWLRPRVRWNRICILLPVVTEHADLWGDSSFGVKATHLHGPLGVGSPPGVWRAPFGQDDFFFFVPLGESSVCSLTLYRYERAEN